MEFQKLIDQMITPDVNNRFKIDRIIQEIEIQLFSTPKVTSFPFLYQFLHPNP